VLNIPWVAVADLLLSNLCDEVGYELYEIDLAVRNQLLRQLKEDEKFGQQRIQELSHFMLYYVRQQLHSDDPDVKDFAQTQRWTALAYTQPGEAVRELALVFSKLAEKDAPELVRMASLTETMAEPLVDFQPLLIYARGMKKFVCGDLEAAKVEFDKALTEKNEIIVADINLPIPEQIAPPKTQPNKNLSRRRVIQYQHNKNLLISSMGAIVISAFCVAWLSQHLNQTPPTTVSISITPSLSPSVEKLTQDLQAVNISFSDPDLRNQLNNPYSKYPQFANGCLKLLEDRRLKQELFFDVIFWNYTQELGGKLNRDSPDGNLDTGILKKAMVTAHNVGYGNKTSSFEDIVEPKQ